MYPDLAHLLWPAQYHKCMITVCFYVCDCCRQTWICLSCRTAATPTWPRSSSQAVRALKTRLPVHCRSGTKWSPRRSNGESGCSLPPMGTVWEASWSTWRVSRTWPQFGYCHSGSASQTASFDIEIKKWSQKINGCNPNMVMLILLIWVPRMFTLTLWNGVKCYKD